MNWDWEKLKSNQQDGRGVPPQVDQKNVLTLLNIRSKECFTK